MILSLWEFNVVLRTLLLFVVLSICLGCSTLTPKQEEELLYWQEQGVYVQKQDAKKAWQLNYFMGAGDFYLGHYDYGFLNLITWPWSMIWAPKAAANRAFKTNWEATKLALGDRYLTLRPPPSPKESDENNEEEQPIMQRIKKAFRERRISEERKKRILEISLVPVDTSLLYDGGPIPQGWRGVLYFRGQHGLLHETYSSGLSDFASSISGIVQIGPEEDRKHISGEQSHWAYRYFLHDNWFIQAGYKERVVSYSYTACFEGSCYRTIDEANWTAKLKMAVAAIGYQAFSGKHSKWVSGVEFHLNTVQKTEMLEDRYSRSRSGESPTLTKSEEAKKQFLDSYGDLIFHIGYLF